MFGKKKSDAGEEPQEGAAGQPEGGETGGDATSADPAKAARFFTHARTVHETGNYEYAMTLWLQGMRFDPSSFTGLESYFRSAMDFARSTKKPGPTRDQLKSFSGKSDVDRFLVALLHWGSKAGMDPAMAVKSVEMAVKLGLDESAHWLGERALAAISHDKKPRKDLLIKLKDLFAQIQAFDLAVKAGSAALAVDPTDGPLDAEVRNLSAQAAMTMGGYEQTGEAGGFRRNIRDADTQRRMEEEGSVVRSEEATSRVLVAAKADYESRPSDTAAVTRYARALLDSGDAESEKTAHQVLMRAYEQSREFRFRQQAGEIKLRRARRQLRSMREQAAGRLNEEKVQQTLKEAERKILEMEIEELSLCVDAYPTDLGYKFQLGKRHLALGQHDKAIEFFQEAQNDGKTRVQSLAFLGQSFLALGWHVEATESFRTALEEHTSPKDELGMELRYGLMRALEERAKVERDLASAEEAVRLASGLAMQQISFRDIRARREGLQKLMQELKTGGAAAG